MRAITASRAALPLTFVALISFGAFACSDNGSNGSTTPTGGSASVAGSGGSTSGAGGSSSMAGTAGSAVAGAGGTAGGGGSAGAGGSGGSGGGGGGAATSKCVVPDGTDDPPAMLSQTGCIDMTAPAKPAPGLIPYAVRSALWSDAAAKERFMSIPSGKKIHVLDCAVDTNACKAPAAGGTGADDGHFDMPVGTVLVKNFSLEGKHIETRLLMNRDILGWVGYSYEWNADQTEAMLLPDDSTGKDKTFGTQVWHYPSRTQCFMCHTSYAGTSLGPSTAQLNSDFAYADGSMNQLEKLKQLGVFDTTPKNIAGLPDPFGADPLEQRARSYIQANCAMCHRPGGEFGSIDMRLQTSLADSKMCDTAERDAGLVPVYRLAPGKPADSGMSVRMHALDKLRMPKIGSAVVDDKGAKLIDDWITALPKSACPNQPQ